MAGFCFSEIILGITTTQHTHTHTSLCFVISSSPPFHSCSHLPNPNRPSLPLFLYQGTVGAGLPIIGTLKHLLETGDKAQVIEGIFSGTLSYIFNTFGDGRPFSEIVADAKAQVGRHLCVCAHVCVYVRVVVVVGRCRALLSSIAVCPVLNCCNSHP